MSTPEVIHGPVWRMGDNIDTDVIAPSQYLSLSSIEEYAAHAFEPLYPDFARSVTPGTIIVAGDNFGIGSSREQAVEIILALGVPIVVARSFGRIFLRNAINNGLWAVEADLDAETGEEISIDFGAGAILTKSSRLSIPVFPESLSAIVNAGGLVPHMKNLNRE